MAVVVVQPVTLTMEIASAATAVLAPVLLDRTLTAAYLVNPVEEEAAVIGTVARVHRPLELGTGRAAVMVDQEAV